MILTLGVNLPPASAHVMLMDVTAATAPLLPEKYSRNSILYTPAENAKPIDRLPLTVAATRTAMAHPPSTSRGMAANARKSTEMF